MQILNTVVDPVRFLKPRAVLELREQTAFELHELLVLSEGWSHEVSTASPYPIYVHGRPKTFQITPKQARFSHGYFLALKLAELHKQEAKPFQTQAYYAAIIKGEVPATKKRKSDFDEPYLDLFMWCVLLNRMDMAELFMTEGNVSRI